MQLILESVHSWIRLSADATRLLARRIGELFVMFVFVINFYRQCPRKEASNLFVTILTNKKYVL